MPKIAISGTNWLEVKCKEIDAERDRRQAISLEYTFPDGITGHIQRRDQKDERNIQGLATASMALVMAGNTTDKVYFLDEENIKHWMTGSEGVQFGMFIQENYATLHNAGREHKDAVKAISEDATKTVQDIINYDYSQGWD